MGGDSGVGRRRDRAAEHGRGQRELTGAKAYRVDSAEESGKRRFALRQDAEGASTPKRAKDSSWRESFHAAAVTSGDQRWRPKLDVRSGVPLDDHHWSTTLGAEGPGRRARSSSRL